MLHEKKRFSVFVLLAPHNFNMQDTEHLAPDLYETMEKHYVDERRKHFFLVFKNLHRKD